MGPPLRRRGPIGSCRRVTTIAAPLSGAHRPEGPAHGLKGSGRPVDISMTGGVLQTAGGTNQGQEGHGRTAVRTSGARALRGRPARPRHLLGGAALAETIGGGFGGSPI